MANNRVYYAIQQVSFTKNSSGYASTAEGTRTVAHGVQSVGLTTTFNLEQVFELGQLAIYENIEGTPDIEVTMTKVLDGYIPLWCLATSDQTDGPQLAKRCTSANKCFVQLGVWDEGKESAGQDSSTAQTWVSMSGLYPTSISYNFPIDDNFSEDITLVGNSKVWGTGQTTSALQCTPSYFPDAAAGAFGGNDDSPVGSGGVNRRQNILLATGNKDQTDTAMMVLQGNNPDLTVLPGDIPGVYVLNNTGVKDTAHLQSMSVSVDVAREELFELGKKVSYARPVTFPIEVTCDIEVISSSGDLVNAIDSCGHMPPGGGGCSSGEANNLANRAIRIASCEGTRIWLGKKNKLASVTYGGGDAGGGNATVTYSYSTFNDFTLIHERDVFVSGGSLSGDKWWQHRHDYMGNGVSSWPY